MSVAFLPGELPHDVLLVRYPRLFLSATHLTLASRNVKDGLHWWVGSVA